MKNLHMNHFPRAVSCGVAFCCELIVRIKPLNEIRGVSNIDFIKRKTFKNVNDKHDIRVWDK